MANVAQLANAIAPIFTSKEGLFLQTIYHPLRLYAEHTLEVSLDVHVDAPRHALPAELEERMFGRVHHVADLGPFSPRRGGDVRRRGARAHDRGRQP
jgi:alpha-N-arabinofuranosidase